MVEEVLNGVQSSELEKLESDVDAIFNSTLNNSTKSEITGFLYDTCTLIKQKN